MSKKFALIGAAGFVAPRHMRAIKENGGDLVAAYDPHDSVGVLDSYFPDCNFFTDNDTFWDCVKKESVDYVSICSPNYLHTHHMVMALCCGANVICEKPIVLESDALAALKYAQDITGRKVNTILQLRLHKDIIALKKRLDPSTHHQVTLNYVAPRGKWYQASWKGDDDKSGGIVTNIGIHLFDLLIHLFGEPVRIVEALITKDYAKGMIGFRGADVSWHLSTEGLKPERSITIDGETLEFSKGFTDLHTISYERVLAGEGFTIEDARPSIRLVNQIRGEKDEI